VPLPARIALALAAYPAGWVVREAAGGALGGLVVLAAIAACAWRLPARRAATVVAAGIACFAVVHVVAGPATVPAGLAAGALLFALAVAAVGWPAWRSSSSAPRDTRAS
jgi:hypothetical protein